MPLPEQRDTLERLVAEGRLEAAAEDLRQCLDRLGSPPEGPPLGERLGKLRRDER